MCCMYLKLSANVANFLDQVSQKFVYETETQVWPPADDMIYVIFGRHIEKYILTDSKSLDTGVNIFANT